VNHQPHNPRHRTSTRALLVLAGIAAALVGLAAPAHAATATPGEASVAANAIHPKPCAYNGGTNRTLGRAEAVTRARSWLGVTPYSQVACYTNQYGDYRTDCSGMVAMAWGLGGYGHDWWTGNLHLISDPIPADQLQPGDALLYAVSDSNASHVALFERWADANHTSPVVVQETGSAHNTIEGVPTNFNWRNYTPIRYDNILETSVSGPVSEAASNNAWRNQQLVSDAGNRVIGESASVTAVNGTKFVYTLNGGLVYEATSANLWRDQRLIAVTVVGTTKYIYTANSDGRIYQAASNNLWTNLWTGVTAGPGKPIAAVSNSTGVQYIYSLSADGGIDEAASDNAWRNRYTGTNTTGNTMSVIVVNGNDKLIYTIDAARRIYEASSTNAWRNAWTGTNAADPGTSISAVSIGNDKYLYTN